MIKLYKARSLLYRRQILQENIRWKAPDDISFTCYCTAQTSIFQTNFVKLFRIFRQNFAKFTHDIVRKEFIEFCSEFDEKRKKEEKENLSESRKYFRRC